MTILKISSGDDYAALSFSNAHAGTRVIDIINNIDSYEAPDEGDDYWELELHVFEGKTEDLDPQLIVWLKNQIDYDDSKHEMYYFDNEIIE